MRAVRRTQELERVLALPRRTYSDFDANALVGLATQYLRTPHGAMTLFREQAIALKEAWEEGGLLLPLGVGRGKTLISLLLAHVFGSRRPLLVLPAKLVKKTRRAIIELSAHWLLPRHIKILSYEILGRLSGKDELDRFQPDLIVFDESHKIKNRKAAVTRRVSRYVEARRELEDDRLVVCAMSGTMTRKSLRDFSHYAQWCLPHHNPLPWTWNELEDWANALDVGGVNPMARVDPGALFDLCGPEDTVPGDDLATVRRAFGRRLAETPGIVASPPGVLGTSLLIDSIDTVPSPAIDAAFETLRKRWELPNGQQLEDGPRVWACARQLALGFYYIWDPPPPLPWAEAFRNCRSFVHDCLRTGRDGDTWLEVCVRHPNEPEVIAWNEIKHTFKPNTVPVWICDSALRMAAQWLHEHPKGICWVEHVAFGTELARMTGFPYYRQGGLTSDKRFIEDATGPIIASVNACRDGFNLQGPGVPPGPRASYCDNLLPAMLSSGEWMQQLLGRTHRTGQEEDQVTCSVYVGCAENVDSLWGPGKALAQARYTSDTTGELQKLCYADIDLPSIEDVVRMSGPRWRR